MVEKWKTRAELKNLGQNLVLFIAALWAFSPPLFIFQRINYPNATAVMISSTCVQLSCNTLHYVLRSKHYKNLTAANDQSRRSSIFQDNSIDHVPGTELLNLGSK